VLEMVAQNAGILSWSWQVSSHEDFNWLLCEVNGQEVAGLSTKTAVWQSQVVQVPAGATVRWIYRKDGSASAGEDAGCLADVAFRSVGTPSSFASWALPYGYTDPQQLVLGSGMPALFAWLGGFGPTLGQGIRPQYDHGTVLQAFGGMDGLHLDGVLGDAAVSVRVFRLLEPAGGSQSAQAVEQGVEMGASASVNRG
jgi:hypothetical protein